jgi:transposase
MAKVQAQSVEELEAQEPAAPTAVATRPVSRAQQMRTMYGDGKTRSEIAKHFDVTYQTVFAATKTMPTNGAASASLGRERVYVDVDGERVPRLQYIRDRYAGGATRGEIAKELNVSYQIVYQATKSMVAPPDEEEVEDDETEEEESKGEEDETEGEEEPATV